ncbi:hypothetical protein [Mycobacterium sp. GA-2829]|nr:hypothetical protein [Mycobacterium sp. GA-2829]
MRRDTRQPRTGELRCTEHVIDGSEAIPEAFPTMFEGGTAGKMVARIV